MAKIPDNRQAHAQRVYAEQKRQAAEGPRVVQSTQGPQGRRLTGNLGPGNLFPGAGKMVQRSGQPVRCGTISGLVFGYTEHPNSRDASRVSTRFAGQFMGVTADNTILQAAECYLPGTVERSLKAALKLRAPGSDPLRISVEVWCEPDDETRPRSPLGYSYVPYDRMAQTQNDPLLALAYEAGILERPAPPPVQLGHDQARPGETIDPETGEILSDPPAAA